MPLNCLKSSVIGVDALYYLENLLAAHKEPLLSALGGFPLALETRIVKELREIQSCGAKLYFVFNGLDWGIKDDQFAISIASARQNATAFDIYENDRAKEAIGVFRESGLIPFGPFGPLGIANSRFGALTLEAGAPTPAALVPFLKKILHENDIPFIVAPYSSLAQVGSPQSSALVCTAKIHSLRTSRNTQASSLTLFTGLLSSLCSVLTKLLRSLILLTYPTIFPIEMAQQICYISI